jgi:two-component system nitrate/nitrite response regulator NarL
MSTSGAPAGYRVRVALADDHPIVLAGLVQLFEAEAGFDVVAIASTGVEALEAVRKHAPDVLVLDLRMPDKDGIEVLRELQLERSTTRVVILTASASEEVLEAIRMGVQGVVLKDMAVELLVRCVRAVHTGNKWIEKVLATRALDSLLARQSAERGPVAALTRRELEVARLIAQGFSNKAVAAKLSITEGTAKLHVHHVYEKLTLDGRMALARFLRREGLE